MCYLIAKNKNGHGCYALKTTHGKALVELKRGLNKTAAPKGIQLVTISRPNAYGEYAHTVLCGMKPNSYTQFTNCVSESENYVQSF